MGVPSKWLGIACLLAAALPPAAYAAWQDRTEAIMGTRIYVQVWADDPAKGNEAIDAVMADMRRIDDLMSHYKPESQLSQINQRAKTRPVQVDKELFDLIKLSTTTRRSPKAPSTSPTPASATCTTTRNHIHPTESQIKSALPAVNWRNMLLDEAHHTVRFEHPGMRIDLGGIGKGYAVDRGIDILKARGIQHAVVTAGGDRRILGDHMGRPWLVGDPQPRRPAARWSRASRSSTRHVSTSGDYERYFDEDGVRYHHIIDPHTGHSASKVRSATIIAPTATQTDGMSKTAFVLGRAEGARDHQPHARIRRGLRHPEGQVLYSNGLRPPTPRPPTLPPTLLRRAPVADPEQRVHFGLRG